MKVLYFVPVILLLWWELELVSAKTKPKSGIVERPLKIGSFNIQKLGNSKFGNEKIMNIVKQVLVRYDLVLVQEIVTTDETLMTRLLGELNSIAPAGTTYMMAISERLGRDRAKEQYAFIYRSERLTFLDARAYPDSYDEFMRPPYIAHFSTPVLRDINSLVAIGIHTQPKNAANETSALADVYDYAAKLYKQKNAIIMGDMNAGCSNVRISDWDTIDLWKRSEFTWLISHDIDTTLSSNCCAYDRFVIAGSGIEAGVIWSSITIFNFRDEFDLNTEEALGVSDHWPIEVQLRGSVSNAVRDKIETKLCIMVEDSRKSAIPADIQKKKSTMGFQILNAEDTVSMYAEDSEREVMLNNLQKMLTKYPGLVSQETVSVVTYKITHGALEDDSAHFDSEDEHSIVIDYDKASMTTTVHFCSNTAVN